jgi:hypothetical protein
VGLAGQSGGVVLGGGFDSWVLVVSLVGQCLVMGSILGSWWSVWWGSALVVGSILGYCC